MTLKPGTRLGPYAIVAPIGAVDTSVTDGSASKRSKLFSERRDQFPHRAEWTRGRAYLSSDSSEQSTAIQGDGWMIRTHRSITRTNGLILRTSARIVRND